MSSVDLTLISGVAMLSFHWLQLQVRGSNLLHYNMVCVCVCFFSILACMPDVTLGAWLNPHFHSFSASVIVTLVVCSYLVTLYTITVSHAVATGLLFVS